MDGTRSLRENYLLAIQELESERARMASAIETLRHYMPPEEQPERIGVVLPSSRVPTPSENWLGFGG